MPRRKTAAPQTVVDGDGYEVGYGRPPTHSRFRPGQSGNPAGRRKGVRNFGTDVMRTLKAPIKVKESGRSRTKSTQEAALMVLREKALRGDARALDRLLSLALQYNSNSDDMGPIQGLATDDQAILAAYKAEVIADAKPPATTRFDTNPVAENVASTDEKARK